MTIAREGGGGRGGGSGSGNRGVVGLQTWWKEKETTV